LPAARANHTVGEPGEIVGELCLAISQCRLSTGSLNRRPQSLSQFPNEMEFSLSPGPGRRLLHRKQAQGWTFLDENKIGERGDAPRLQLKLRHGTQSLIAVDVLNCDDLAGPVGGEELRVECRERVLAHD
jgi:hypothetical protein